MSQIIYQPDGSILIEADAFVTTRSQIQAFAKQGVAPFSVYSNTFVANLNVEFLNSQPAEYYLDYNNFTNLPILTFAELGDTNIAAPQNYDILYYDSNNSEWTNLNIGEAGEVLTANSQGQLEWQAPAGAGLISNAGTGGTNRVTYWIDASTIGGDTNFTWDGSDLRVNGQIGVNVAAIYPIDVYDATADVLARLVSGDANAFIDIRDVNTTAGYVRYGAVGDDAVLWAGNAERLRITSIGNFLFKDAITSPISTNIASGIRPGFQIKDDTTGSGASLLLQRTGTTAAGPYLMLAKTAGDNYTTNLIDGDQLGRILFLSPNDDATTPALVASAEILGAADGNHAPNDIPGRIVFLTVPSGSQTLSERMRIKSDGDINILNDVKIGGSATDTPLARLEISGTTTAGGIYIEDSSVTSAAPGIEIIGKRSDGNASQSFGGKLMLAGNRTDASVISGKNLGTIGFGGNHTDGTVANILYTASISGISEGTFTNSTTMPTGLAFYTGSTGQDPDTPNITTGTERMRITSDGFVGINTTSPIAPLEILATDSVANATYYAMNIDMNSSGADAISGGNKAHIGLRMNLDSSATGGTTVDAEEHQVYGALLDIDVTGDSDLIRGYYTNTRSALSSGTTTNLRGVDGVVEADPASGGTISYAYAGYFHGLHGGVGTVSNLYGSYNRAEKQADSGTSVLTNAVGAFNFVYNSANTPGADSTITNAYGSLNEVQVVDTHDQGVAVSNAQGVRSVIDVDTNRAGVVTTGYLFRGDYQLVNASSVTNPWGIYLTGSTDNYIEGDMVFSDSVKIGGTAGDTPSDLLHLESASNPAIRLNESADPDSYTLLQFSANTQTLFNHYTSAGEGSPIMDINPIAADNVAQYVRIFRSSNSLGTASFRVHNPGGTDIQHALQSSTLDSYLCAQGGDLGIGNTTPSAKLHVTNAGTGDSLRIDDAGTDATPFIIDVNGRMVQGHTDYLLGGSAATFEQHSNSNYSTVGAPNIAIANWSTNSAFAGGLAFHRSLSGTVGTETAVVDNTDLGSIYWLATDASGFLQAAQITAEMDAAPAGSGVDMPGRLIFSTTAVGDTAPTERMRIDSAGDVGIGTTDPDNKLHVAGSISLDAYLSGTPGKGIFFRDGFNESTSPFNLAILTHDFTGEASGNTSPDSLMLTGFDGVAIHTGSNTYDAANIRILAQQDGDVNILGNTKIGGSAGQTPVSELQVQGVATGVGNSDAIVNIDDTTAMAADVGGTLALRGYDGAVGPNMRTLALIKGGKANATEDNFDGYLGLFARQSAVADAVEAQRLYHDRVNILNDVKIGGAAGDTPLAPLEVYNPSLGGTAGDVKELLTLRTTSGNEQYLEFFALREENGTDWTSAGTRIQSRIDSTYQSWIEFNGTAGDHAISFGTGNDGGATNPQAVSERMRIKSDGDINILNDVKIGGSAGDTPTERLEVAGGNIEVQDTYGVIYRRNSTQYMVIDSNGQTSTSPAIGSYTATNNAKVIHYNSTTDAWSGTQHTAGTLGHKFLIRDATYFQILQDTTPTTLIYAYADIVPGADSAYDLGSDSLYWANTYSDRFISSYTEDNSLDDAAIWLKGSSGAILLDSNGEKRISWNDGGGNFQIRAGHYAKDLGGSSWQETRVAPGDNDGAALIQMTTDDSDGVITFRTAVAGTDDTALGWTNYLILDSNPNELYTNVPVFRPNNDSATALGTTSEYWSGIYTDNVYTATIHGYSGSSYSSLNLKATQYTIQDEAGRANSHFAYGVDNDIYLSFGDTGSVIIRSDTGAAYTNRFTANTSGLYPAQDSTYDLGSTSAAWYAIHGDFHQLGLTEIPTDFWNSTAYWAGSLGYVGTNGSFGMDIVSNGYRNSGGTWTSFNIDSETGGAIVSLRPTGDIFFGMDNSTTGITGTTQPAIRYKMDETGFYPNADSAYDLGSTSLRWAEIHSDTIHVNGAGTTIGGNTWDNGWLKIGSSTLGWAFDSNELYNAGDGIIGSISGGTLTFVNIPAFNGGTSGSSSPFTVDSTQVVTNLNADLLDGEEGSYYLNTSTSFGGDVSGTYNAIVVANDSHTHAFDNLTSKTSGTGEYSTSGNLTSGRGSGGVSLTINDGYGNANVTWNHKSGVPEQSGNAARIEVNTDDTTNARMFFEAKSNVTAAAVTLSTMATMYADTGNLDVVGDVTAYSSDKRLKTNVVPITNALDMIDKINGYKFDWNKEVCNQAGFCPDNTTEYGVIAQEIQEIMPELVIRAPFDKKQDNNGNDIEDPPGYDYYKTVKYDKLTALLIAAVKELKAEIEELKRRK